LYWIGLDWIYYIVLHWIGLYWVGLDLLHCIVLYCFVRGLYKTHIGLNIVAYLL